MIRLTIRICLGIAFSLALLPLQPASALPLGYRRVATVNKIPANQEAKSPGQLAQEILKELHTAVEGGAEVILLPELTIQDASKTEAVLAALAGDPVAKQATFIVGAPFLEKDIEPGHQAGGRVAAPGDGKSKPYKAAFVISGGNVAGAIPQESHDPEYEDGFNVDRKITINGKQVRLNSNQIFKLPNDFRFGVEVSKDAQAIIPPSEYLATHQAQAIFTLSNPLAVNRQTQKLIDIQSSKNIAAHITQGYISDMGENIVMAEEYKKDITFADINPAEIDSRRVHEYGFHAVSDTKTKYKEVPVGRNLPLKEKINITVASPKVSLGDPKANLKEFKNVIEQESAKNSDVIVFPELSLTGYENRDIFKEQNLLNATKEALEDLLKYSKGKTPTIVVGAPFQYGSDVYNVAFVIHDGEIIGAVPKTHLAHRGVFEEASFFASALKLPAEILNGGEVIKFLGQKFYFTPKQLFIQNGKKLSIDICQDLWEPGSTGQQAMNQGAQVILNLSASPDLGDDKYKTREDLVNLMSAKGVAYVYAGSQPGDTMAAVLGKHLIISENGQVVREVKASSPENMISMEVSGGSSAGAVRRQKRRNDYKTVHLATGEPENDSQGFTAFHKLINPEPYHFECDDAKQYFDRQVRALVSKMQSAPNVLQSMVVGISGGLDSTLALLVATEASRQLWGMEGPKKVHAITMPGYGTGVNSRKYATNLMGQLGVHAEEYGVSAAADAILHIVKPNPSEGLKKLGLTLESGRHLLGEGYEHATEKTILDSLIALELKDLLKETPDDTDANKAKRKQLEGLMNPFKDLKILHQKPIRKIGRNTEGWAGDTLTIENIQARLRTLLLFTVAGLYGNGSVVVGTGDLSEIYLGNCTYGADQFSIYGINAGMTKTGVKRIVACYGKELEKGSQLRETLNNIRAIDVSPELLPVLEEEQALSQQRTEDRLGPYVLHDFFIKRMFCDHASVSQTFIEACHAFGAFLPAEVIQARKDADTRRYNDLQSALKNGESVEKILNELPPPPPTFTWDEIEKTLNSNLWHRATQIYKGATIAPGPQLLTCGVDPRYFDKVPQDLRGWLANQKAELAKTVSKFKKGEIWAGFPNTAGQQLVGAAPGCTPAPGAAPLAPGAANGLSGAAKIGSEFLNGDKR